MKDENVSYLRWNITHLVRVWTALSMIRKVRGNETLYVFKDVCSDKLRNMLHELANKKKWTLGFTKDGLEKHQRLFKRLIDANKWFESKEGKHYRNVGGSHMQPLPIADHMFQQFGYGGEREWKHLTKGVAACVAMMKMIDGGKFASWWREKRKCVRDGELKQHVSSDGIAMEIPNALDALLLDLRIE